MWMLSWVKIVSINISNVVYDKTEKGKRLPRYLQPKKSTYTAHVK